MVLRLGETAFDIVMEVENLSAAPMDLMYLCHVNFAFAPSARIVQSVPFTLQHVVARTAIPSHVVPTPEYRAQIESFAAHPERLRVLDPKERYDPEQVFYVKGLKRGADDLIHFMLLRPEGDAFAIAWDPESMPQAIRWILDSKDSARRSLRDARDLRTGGLHGQQAEGERAQPPERRKGALRHPRRLCRQRACSAADRIEGNQR